MKKYGVNELRKMYLDFFEGKEHLVMKSFSLVPHNDNSLLLINAGMHRLSHILQGRKYLLKSVWRHARSVYAQVIFRM